MRKVRRRVQERLVDTVGGRTRLRVVAALAGVLALDSADKATLGAVAPQLKAAMGIGNLRLGVLAAVTTLVAMVATPPLGALSDRVHRVRLLCIAVVVWSAATVASGFTGSFGWLLATRLVLGAVAAASGPVIASLIGDLVPPAERGRIYGFVLTGELLGSGLGFLLSGEVAALLSWRAAFWMLGLVGLVVAAVARRLLFEPERGGGGQLPPARGTAAARSADTQLAQDVVVREGVEPDRGRVLDVDPARRSSWWAARYVLSIPTYRLFIAASSLGYFFFAGLRTFAVVFAMSRFGLPHATASVVLVLIGLGAVLGSLSTGRLADRLLSRGEAAARPLVAGASYLVAAVFLLPGLLVPGLAAAAPLFFLAAAGFAGANPPLDAGRLDLVHHRLWGRAEGIRTVFRSFAEALAPLAFGVVSVLFAGRTATLRGSASGQTVGEGLQPTFLVMVAPVAIAGLLLLIRARRTYPRDLATAAASAERLQPADS